MIIAVLGKRDSPTDAVDDYCRLLGEVFEKRGRDFTLVRVSWDESGWTRALKELWRTSAGWKGSWVLVQYTALMWSRRGIPLLFLLVLAVLKVRGTRVAMVFHDPHPYGGKRLVDRLRRACQVSVMRCSYRFGERSILNVPLENVPWLPSEPATAFFTPIPANITPTRFSLRAADSDTKAIAVLGITDGGDISREVSDITMAARRAARRLPRVRLVTVGRGSAWSESMFRSALEGSGVDFVALGVLSADKVSQVLANADVSLFVRGRISTQRGSAIASIAHGVPLVAYADPHLPVQLAEAGVVGVPYLDAEDLAEATVRVLTDRKLWCELHERNRRAHEKYFSWEVVGNRFLEVLRDA
ncbi:MAG: glycosyltransferase [Terriglobia bacterium]